MPVSPKPSLSVPMPMNMPMPSPSPSPGAMGNMPGMENKQGMGSMNMGPLLVMTGSDMSIRVGASETNLMSMGAIASGGVRVVNEAVVQHLDIAPEVLDAVAAREQDELRRRERAYRDERPAPDVRGRTRSRCSADGGKG